MKYTSLERNVLLVATLSSFLTPFMGSSVIVSLPRIGHELSMNVLTLSWISTAYQLAAAAFLVPIGRLADIHGRKRIFLLGILLDNLSSLLGAFSTSSDMLIVARVFQGIGGAMIFATGVTILTSVFSPEQRGRVLGINVAGVYAGLSTGPFIGGFLTGHLGWRSVFLSNVLIGIIILVTTLWKLKGEWAPGPGRAVRPGRFPYLYGFPRVDDVRPFFRAGTSCFHPGYRRCDGHSLLRGMGAEGGEPGA